MKKMTFAARAWLFNKALSVYRQYLSPSEIKATLMAVILSVLPVVAMAQSASIADLSGATGIICMITNYVSGPVLYGLGVILIIIGAIAIASSESTISKLVSSVVVGLGLAACAVNIVKNHLGVNYIC